TPGEPPPPPRRPRHIVVGPWAAGFAPKNLPTHSCPASESAPRVQVPRECRGWLFHWLPSAADTTTDDGGDGGQRRRTTTLQGSAPHPLHAPPPQLAPLLLLLLLLLLLRRSPTSSLGARPHGRPTQPSRHHDDAAADHPPAGG